MLQGHTAFLSEEGFPYDVLVDANNKLYRLQVKSATRATIPRTMRDPIYDFYLTSNQGKHRISPRFVDYIALVALDQLKVAYFPIHRLIGEQERTVRRLMLRSRVFDYRKTGSQQTLYLEDFSTLTIT